MDKILIQEVTVVVVVAAAAVAAVLVVEIQEYKIKLYKKFKPIIIRGSGGGKGGGGGSSGWFLPCASAATKSSCGMHIRIG